MSEWIWLNGEMLPAADAHVCIDDRGFQFADGVYEMIRVYDGELFAVDAHLHRLWTSAVEIQLTPPMTTDALAAALRNYIEKSDLHNANIYLQLTRGPAPRDHLFPDVAEPTLLFYARPVPKQVPPGEGEGVKLLSVNDDRWRRCWIKTTSLLSNVLAKNSAVAAGADEAAFVEGGQVSECSTANLFAVINGKLVTHEIGSRVLPGITRRIVIELAHEMGLEVDERAIGEDEARRADELFITSTSREIGWVSRWNDVYIGQGRCGHITRKLQQAFQERVRQETKAENLATV